MKTEEEADDEESLAVDVRPSTIEVLPLGQYDRVIVSFSGGKDSLACVLHLLELGVTPDRMELWHQAVDGQPGVARRFFDWPVTEAYCNAAAQVLGITIRYQWRNNGFFGEMTKGEIFASDDPAYTLSSNAITGYFRIDQDGSIWATRRYENATKFSSPEDAEAWRGMLPQEGTQLPRYLNAKEVEKIDREHKKKLAEAKLIVDKKSREKRASEIEKWYAGQTGPLTMPSPHRVEVTMPRRTDTVGFELSPGGLASGHLAEGSGGGTPGVRMQFPDAVGPLNRRWCSAVLKIDVAAIAITNDPTFDAGTFLYISGERREESNKRAKYAEAEEHRSSTKARRVDHWRPVIDWTEAQVWEIISRWRIRPHPAYYLGWGRLSCLSCIFGNADQWAAVQQVAPHLFQEILHYERRFSKTIQQGGDIAHLAGMGQSFVPDDPSMIALAMGEALGIDYVQLGAGEEWVMPIGAFKKTGGPL